MLEKDFKYRSIADEDRKFEIVESIISKLPKWFDEKGRKDYPKAAKRQRLIVAFNEGVAVGFIALQEIMSTLQIFVLLEFLKIP